MQEIPWPAGSRPARTTHRTSPPTVSRETTPGSNGRRGWLEAELATPLGGPSIGPLARGHVDHRSMAMPWSWTSRRRPVPGRRPPLHQEEAGRVAGSCTRGQAAGVTADRCPAHTGRRFHVKRIKVPPGPRHRAQRERDSWPATPRNTRRAHAAHRIHGPTVDPDPVDPTRSQGSDREGTNRNRSMSQECSVAARAVQLRASIHIDVASATTTQPSCHAQPGGRQCRDAACGPHPPPATAPSWDRIGGGTSPATPAGVSRTSMGQAATASQVRSPPAERRWPARFTSVVRRPSASFQRAPR